MDAVTQRVEDIFYAALEMKAREEREAFLQGACAGDVPLRAAVDAMLAAQGDVESFFRGRHPGADLPRAMAEASEFRAHDTAVLSDSEEVGKRIGRYKLLQKIGEGGCGVVYMAEQEAPVRRKVALKVIKLGMDTKNVIARFEAERQALALMDHPNIARVLDAGATEKGRPFFVMELVRGVRFTTYCDEHQFDPRQRLDLFVQVCQAIQHAHQKGVVHRDIKPSNILVTMLDGKPVPKVIDFGIAKAIEGRLTDQTLFTAYEQFVGTPAYMSPEQAQMSGMDVDTRSDIYSLGVLLYELLTGRTPFDQKELLQSGFDEMRRTLREREPHRPSTKLDVLRFEELTQTAIHRHVEPRRLKSLLSGDLDWIVMKALEKDRGRRYQSASGLAADVQRFLNHEPVVARPPSRLYRLQKLVRRNRVVFAAGTAVALAVLIGFGASTWMFIREREARQVANQALAAEARLRHEAEAQADITQAAILISRKRFLEADELVAHLDLPVMKPSLEAADVFRKLADWHVTEGHWEPAARRLLKLIQANQIDQTDMTDDATRELLKVGPPLVLIGATNDYVGFYRGVIQRFAGTRNPVAAEQVIKSSTLLPLDRAAAESLEPLVAIVEKSIPDNPPATALETYMTGWRAFALACFNYRCGHYTNAAAWADRCLSYRDPTPTRIVGAHAILALASHRLGQEGKARAELAEARRLMGDKLSTPLTEGLPLGGDAAGYWYDWIEAHLLLNEAARDIEGGDSGIQLGAGPRG
jgi:serine/threonine protein kinase